MSLMLNRRNGMAGGGYGGMMGLGGGRFNGMSGGGMGLTNMSRLGQNFGGFNRGTINNIGGGLISGMGGTSLSRGLNGGNLFAPQIGGGITNFGIGGGGFNQLGTAALTGLNGISGLTALGNQGLGLGALGLGAVQGCCSNCSIHPLTNEHVCVCLTNPQIIQAGLFVCDCQICPLRAGLAGGLGLGLGGLGGLNAINGLNAYGGGLF